MDIILGAPYSWCQKYTRKLVMPSEKLQEIVHLGTEVIYSFLHADIVVRCIAFSLLTTPSWYIN